MPCSVSNSKPTISNSVFCQVKNFLNDSSGNFAISAGLALVPLVFSVGLTVDYTELYKKQTDYQNALDSAVLATATHYNQARNEAEALEFGKNYFEDNCGDDCDANYTPVIKIVDNKYVHGTAEGDIETGFTSLFSGDKLGFDVDAQVNLKANPKHQEYWFIVDVSASFGIGASTTQVNDLMAVTKPYSQNVGYAPDGCAFACHEVTPEKWERQVKINGKTEHQPTYDWANELGIALRNDVLETQFHFALDKVLSDINGTHANRVKAGLMVFSDDLETLTKPSANSQNIKAAYTDKKISIRRWGSRHDLVLPEAARLIGESGTGSDKNDPVKTVVLITDGVTSNYSNFDFKAIDPQTCQSFKDNNVRVVVLDIVYPNLKNDGIFNSMVAPFYGNISPALKSCASPGFYYQNGNDAEIAASLEKLVNESIDYEVALSK